MCIFARSRTKSTKIRKFLRRNQFQRVPSDMILADEKRDIEEEGDGGTHDDSYIHSHQQDTPPSHTTNSQLFSHLHPLSQPLSPPPPPQHNHTDTTDHDEENRAKHFNRGQKKTICWFDPPCEPLTLSYFFSVRGQDGFHVYLWIMKDLSWVQAWYWPGLIFGTLTLIWSAFMLWRAFWRKSLDEVWTHSAQFMWLFGNFLWMQGELHDYKYPNEPSIYNQRADQGGYIFIAALIWIGIYYCIAKPLNITSSPEINAAYDTTGFQCRFPYFFQSWREYENVHILFWIGKDCFWCWYIDYMWVIFFIPTLLIAFDFCYVSLRGKNMIIDHAHYVAQLLWVSANATWGAGEFWFSVNHDSALSMTSWNRDIRLTFRWYSAWVVVSAYVPLILLYLIWIPSTIIGRIEDDEDRHAALLRRTLPSSSSTTNSMNSMPQSSLFRQTYGRIRAWSTTKGIQLNSSPNYSESSSIPPPPHTDTGSGLNPSYLFHENTSMNNQNSTALTIQNSQSHTDEINPIQLGNDYAY